VSDLKALVLAAGEGTRLRPLTYNIPKPMLMVAGRPFLSHQIEALASVGVKDVYVLVGWKSNRVKEYLLEAFGDSLSIRFLDQKQRLGTAHAIGMAKKEMEEAFLCVNGDLVISPSDIAQMTELFKRKKKTILGAVTVDDPSRFGVIEQEGGKMRRILEKPLQPPSNLINAGVSILTPDVFDFIERTSRSPRGEFEITDTLNMMADRMDVLVHQLTGEWIDVARPWDLLDANALLMTMLSSSISGEVEGGVVIKGPVVVEKGAVVRAGSYIQGPAYISAGCDVGPNCYLRPSTCLGPKCRIGSAVEIKNSIVMAETKIPHHSYVGDSIIGERCNLGCGTKVANLRFDDTTVKVSTEGGLMDTGRRKLGVIMGDDVKTGINSMIDVGTVIYEHAYVGPGALASGMIGPGSRIL